MSTRPLLSTAAATVLLLVTCVGSSEAVAGAEPPAAVSPSAMQPWLIPEVGTRPVGIPLCHEPTDIDCLAPLVIVRSGKRIQPELVFEGTAESGQSLWTYAGPDGKDVTLRVFAELTPVGVIQSWGGQIPGARVFVSREPDADHPVHKLSEVDCTTGVRDDCIVGPPAMPARDSVQIRLRMSWLTPLNMATTGKDIAFKRIGRENGNEFVFSAKEQHRALVRNQDVTPVEEWSAVALEGGLFFIIDHAGKDSSESAYDPRCAGRGAAVTGSNSQAAGQLYWDESSQSLNFGIVGVHRDPSGSLYKGRFEATFPLAWLRCQSRSADLSLNGFIIQVLNEDGTEQVATTSIAQKKGIVTVRALNFHYSSPTIRLIKDPS